MAATATCCVVPLRFEEEQAGLILRAGEPLLDYGNQGLAEVWAGLNLELSAVDSPSTKGKVVASAYFILNAAQYALHDKKFSICKGLKKTTARTS